MRAFVAVCAALVMLGAPGTALAHGDERLVSETLTLAPGETVAFDGELHYHRLVGRFTADGPVEVRLVRVDTGATAITLARGADLAVNRLVPCCDRIAWTPHQLEIRNPGDRVVVVDARVSLVHDDLAVMVYRAEAGTAESVVVMGALWAWALVRSRRRWSPTSAASAAVSVGAVIGVIAVLVLYGTARYGVGSAPGLVAGLGDLPVVPFNPMVSRASLLMGAAMIGWAAVPLRWVRAADAMGRSGWIGLGLLVVGAVFVVAVAVGTTYRVAAMPVAMALTAAVPVLVVMVVELRHRRTGAGSVPVRGPSRIGGR